jgi:uncharacterized protein
MTSKRSSSPLASSLLTLAALALALGALALFVIIRPTLSPGTTWLLAVTFLVSGAVSALSGAWLLSAWQARRNHPGAATAAPERPASENPISRRAFLKLAALEMTLGGATVATAGYLTRLESHWVQVQEVQVPIAGLTPRLDGLRIVQLSDIHLSAAAPRSYLQRVVATAQSLAPELIVLTGDYDTPDCAPILAPLHAPLGVYAVLGNRDYGNDNGAEPMSEALQAAGLTLLRNQGRPIARDGGHHADLWLAGLDDVLERKDDLETSLREAPVGVPVLLLVHEPDYAARITGRAAELGIVLQLSGHSHGGQVRLPFIGAPILPYLGQKYPMGLQRVGAMWVYTNRGIGMTRPAVRLNCRPEITVITLRRA